MFLPWVTFCLFLFTFLPRILVLRSTKLACICSFLLVMCPWLDMDGKSGGWVGNSPLPIYCAFVLPHPLSTLHPSPPSVHTIHLLSVSLTPPPLLSIPLPVKSSSHPHHLFPPTVSHSSLSTIHSFSRHSSPPQHPPPVSFLQ